MQILLYSLVFRSLEFAELKGTLINRRESRMELLKAIGFWRSKTSWLIWPHPDELIRDWQEDEKQRVVEYLRTGTVINEQLGFGKPRFPEIDDVTKLGCGEQTDGEWVWPESLPYYVLHYDVGVPELLIEKSKTGLIDLDAQELENFSYDYSYWNHWCQEKRKNRIYSLISKAWLTATDRFTQGK